MELLKILVWPVAVILIIVFIVLLLKKSFQDLLTRVTRLKYGDTVAEVSQTRQEPNENSLLAQNQADKQNETIEKALGLFSISTVAKAKSVVENESKINEINDDHKKVETLIKYSEALYLILSFERIYYNIFGSQLYILDFINTNFTQTKSDLKIFYDNAKEKYTEFYDGYSYDNYFAFLINHDLITITEDNICSITWLGRDLLKYLIETGKSISKRY
jgi:hypothetical protein